MKTTPHSFRPLRESREHKNAEHIQQEIDLMRAMYAQRGPSNNPRINLIAWYAVGVIIGGIIALIFFF